MTVATAGRAVFFSGLTVLLGLLGLVLFEFMILRSVGIAGAIVVGLAVAAALTLLPALLTIARAAARPVRGPPGGRRRPARTAPGPGSPGGSCAGRSRSSSRRSAVPAAPRLAVPARPVQRAGRLDPAAGACRRAQAFDRLDDEFGEGEFAPIVARDPDRPARRPSRPTWPRCYDYSRRLAADPRISRVDSLVDVDPRLTLAQYQLLYGDPNGPRDRFVATALAATTRGDLTAFTIYTPYGPNRDEGRAAGRGPARPGAARSPRRPA